MRHRRRLAVGVPMILLATILTPGSAAQAHPEHSFARELFAGEGVVHGDQHGGTEGHLPAVQRGVRVVGRAEVTNPSGAGNEGRIADLSAHGNYAFLTAFRNPTCEQTGVHVINMRNPRRPFEVTSAFMPTDDGNYAGEGSDVIEMRNRHFRGVLLMHQNETCPDATAPTAPRTRGGINIWDVTDAEEPELLAAHAGDYTAPDGSLDDQANQVHSQFAWTNRFTGRTYVVMVDDEETTDLDILDITNPRDPVLINDTLDLASEPFNVAQDTPSNLQSVFSHDMTVKQIGRRYVMNAAYWDGGYVLLDVTDPRPEGITLIAESDYANLDEQRLEGGVEISPEGNGHQSELSPDNRFLVATDEDFNPFRVHVSITSGAHAGASHQAIPAADTPPLDEDTTLTGTPTYVGQACGPLPAGEGVALIERGTCAFQVKLDNVTAAGYEMGVVFNAAVPGCLSPLTMQASGDIPYVFVGRLAGLQLLGVAGANEDNACDTAVPAAAQTASIEVGSVLDGWGYVRLFRTHIPRWSGGTGSITQIDTFAIPESQDPEFANGFGDLSVHEVALDPRRQLAYVSYYAGGLRVLSYGDRGLREVGAYIGRGGNNFWGVEVHRMGGRQYVLASDRDFGLYIFEIRH